MPHVLIHARFIFNVYFLLCLIPGHFGWGRFFMHRIQKLWSNQIPLDSYVVRIYLKWIWIVECPGFKFYWKNLYTELYPIFPLMQLHALLLPTFLFLPEIPISSLLKTENSCKTDLGGTNQWLREEIRRNLNGADKIHCR